MKEKSIEIQCLARQIESCLEGVLAIAENLQGISEMDFQEHSRNLCIISLDKLKQIQQMAEQIEIA